MPDPERQGTIDIEVSYEWLAVENAPGTPYVFPEALSDYARDRYDVPAVYRWIVGGVLGGPGHVQVGEADSLLRAVSACRSPAPGHQAEARLKKMLTEAMLGGGDVRLEMLRLVSLRFGDRNYGARDMRQAAVRQLLKGVLALRSAAPSAREHPEDLLGLL